MEIHGWGRYPRIEAVPHMPSSPSGVASCLSALNGHGAIGRGLGRSYGDSALAGHVIHSRYLDLLLDFDAASGVVRCGAGVSLAELIETFLPRGWFLSVSPGTKFVTVGGAIASDVHGKNHHIDGCFSEFVSSLVVMLGSGEAVTCSREDHPDLFRATCGGMGLTGIILEATLHLKAVSGAQIDQQLLKAASLRDAMDILDLRESSTYTVAWIDCLASGATLGRSLVMLGEHASDGHVSPGSARRLTIPFDMPAQLLNRFSIKAFNALYYHRVQKKISRSQVHYETFFYPLDGIGEWNRLYGKHGFVQYQFVLPKQAGFEGMRAILKKISDSRRGSFLAVLKLFGKQNVNLLSFPIEGYTLALDFKIESSLFALLDELDDMVLDHGGRLYLAKDARMSTATFRKSYPAWERFQEIRSHYGAIGKFASRQSQRLGLT